MTDYNYSRDSFGITINVVGIKTSDYEKLEQLGELMEMVIRGICQECDGKAIYLYDTCDHNVFKEELE